jgi:hypothetical protein
VSSGCDVSTQSRRAAEDTQRSTSWAAYAAREGKKTAEYKSRAEWQIDAIGGLTPFVSGMATLKVYPALNHLFISGEGRSMPEYFQPRHVDPQVIADIADWIHRN